MKRTTIGMAAGILSLVMFAGCSLHDSDEVFTEETDSSAVQESSSGQETQEETSTAVPATEEETERKEDENPPGYEKTIIIGSDTHYLSPDLSDNGPAFQEMVLHGDGRLVTYMDQITDAFFEEVIEASPDILILSGDLSSNGELESHRELAEKLRKVESMGVPVVVIPGNHDINNLSAAGFRGEEKYPVEYTTPEQFRQIYGKFGYDEAVSEDEGTLSYVYQLDDMTRLLMIDTCQYQEGFARVGGYISPETYEWMEEQLEAAWNEGMNVIPVAHHNLLEESQVYTVDCTIEHSEEFVRQLESWNVPLFLSGHLHVQHWMQDEDSGIYEIVVSSLTTPNCMYGELTFRDDGSFDYNTKEVDVEKWAEENGRTEEELLNFKEFREPFLEQVFKNDAYGVLKGMKDITEEERLEMCDFYARLKYQYYQGRAVDMKDKALKENAYALWDSKGYMTVQRDYVVFILEDAVKDYNHLKVD